MNNITGKSKIIYLILALACFIGITLIFLFDGYMGVYDTLTMKSGEQTQVIDTEQWVNNTRYMYPAYLFANAAGKTSFSYEIDNRRLSSYQAVVSVSIWKNQSKLDDVLTSSVNIGVFSRQTVTWEIDTTQYITGNGTADNQFTLQIDNGGIRREVIISVPPQGLKRLNQPGVTVISRVEVD